MKRWFRFGRRLGRGAHGEVYEGVLESEGAFRKPVALKVLNPGRAGDALVRGRLRDEARLLGLLNHPALLRVDGFESSDALTFVVMERVDGNTLLELSDRYAPLPEAVVLQVGRDVAGGLHAALTTEVDGEPLGMTHRDVKPSNLHLTIDGVVKLLDFGIATAEFAGRESADPGIAGTPAYMAPEQRVGAAGPEADVFALGLVMARCLTGRTPPDVRDGAHDDRVAAVLEGVPELWRSRLAPMVSLDPRARPSAAAVEAMCGAWLATVPFDVQGWARDHVRVAEGEEGALTGRVIEVEGMPAPRSGRPTCGVIAGLVALASAGIALVLLVLSVTSCLGSVGTWVWGNVSSHACIAESERIREQLLVVDADPGAREPAIRAATELRRSCAAHALQFVPLTTLGMEVDELLEDGHLSREESDAFVDRVHHDVGE